MARLYFFLGAVFPETVFSVGRFAAFHEFQPPRSAAVFLIP
jgi:hypothetical protein